MPSRVAIQYDEQRIERRLDRLCQLELGRERQLRQHFQQSSLVIEQAAFLPAEEAEEDGRLGEAGGAKEGADDYRISDRVKRGAEGLRDPDGIGRGVGGEGRREVEVLSWGEEVDLVGSVEDETCVGEIQVSTYRMQQFLQNRAETHDDLRPAQKQLPHPGREVDTQTRTASRARMSPALCPSPSNLIDFER
jgi:hypothetical protein